MALQLRLNRGVRTPNLHRFFSSSSDSSNGVNHTNESQFPSSNDSESNQNPNPQSQRPSYSSYFSDVKASLRQSPSPLPRRNPQSFSPSIPPPSKVASLDEIRKNLSEFRHRSSPPLPDNPSGPPSQSPSSSPSPAISLQELYKRNAMGSNENTTEGNKNEKRTFDSIRESLRQMRTQNPNNPIRPNDRWGNNNSRKVVDPSGVLSLQGLKDSLNLKPGDGGKVSSNVVMRGLETSPPSAIFGKESGEKKETDLEANAEFVKQYNYRELGEKLRVLRAKGGFSLKELNERLVRLREFEEMEMNKKGGGVSFGDLRASLVKLRTESNDNKRRSAMQRFDILGTLVGTEQYLRGPPKEHLVEKYFHPDNLSSEEKMKMELQKVRDEFKTSESDCGSSRVQVAQLTTKIKHLSSVLHKKDKHSRKGLMAMVQRRKKLLKYLRRTDWDSYCFVISKLGLRDNPDNKQGYPVSEKKKKKHVPQKKRKGKKQGASKANTNSDAPISA